ncbi:MAG: hypothetical protein IPJ16_09760 [Bacteroidales bacterium]|nr:hypothetical protein [Bacteroidales bacterium]
MAYENSTNKAENAESLQESRILILADILLFLVYYIMRKPTLILLFISLTINSIAQYEGDHIDRSKFCIIKTGTDLDTTAKIKVTELKSVKTIQQQYGSNCIITKYVDVLTDEPGSEIKYTDGLVLNISDRPGTTNFRITSDKYSLLLDNGKIIKVGMTESEFKDIFPKSFSKRNFVTQNKKERIYFSVHFSFMRNNKVLIEDAWISFFFDCETGTLDNFYSLDAP